MFYTDFVEMKAKKYHLVVVANQNPLAFVLWARQNNVDTYCLMKHI